MNYTKGDIVTLPVPDKIGIWSPYNMDRQEFYKDIKHRNICKKPVKIYDRKIYGGIDCLLIEVPHYHGDMYYCYPIIQEQEIY